MKDLEKTVIEINGIKMEVDLRYAKKIENYKVGDNIKVLTRDYDSSPYRSHPGVIIGFDDFEKLPTIIVCYCETGYRAEVKFAYLNTESKNIEICHMNEHEKILDKGKVTDHLDDLIRSKQNEVDEMVRKRNFFQEKYNEYFVPEIQPEVPF
jgi:hypothetical protein